MRSSVMLSLPVVAVTGAHLFSDSGKRYSPESSRSMRRPRSVVTESAFLARRTMRGRFPRVLCLVHCLVFPLADVCSTVKALWGGRPQNCFDLFENTLTWSGALQVRLPPLSAEKWRMRVSRCWAASACAFSQTPSSV